MQQKDNINTDKNILDPDQQKNNINAGNTKHYTTMEDIEKNNIETPHVVNESSPQNFAWINVIGQGTFGVVYKARAIDTGKLVAIKKVFQDPKYRNREFSIVSEMDHVNTIKIHSYFYTKGEENPEEIYLNIVMDFIPDTLYRVLRYYKKTKRAFPNTLGKLYAYQMFRALAYVHSQKICHRDIKPQNILVDTKNHRLVLCDFGSAKKLNPFESSIAYICSRYYRAPEQILGTKEYGCEIDVWSIGCVIAEMFLGDPIFMGNTNKEQFLRIIQVIGVPSDKDYAAMGYNGRLHIPKMNFIGLRNKIKGIDPLAQDLISKQLTYDPKKRLVPFQAQQHPYFNELREYNVTTNNKPTVELFNFKINEIGDNSNLLPKQVPEWYDPQDKENQKNKQNVYKDTNI